MMYKKERACDREWTICTSDIAMAPDSKRSKCLRCGSIDYERVTGDKCGANVLANDNH